ncbi:MAG: PilZ domain-containing protein [Desulfocapsaceae bacterium]|nr:PilZ domain-containing protein [Desulfocapsaceae bacterium]
MTEKRRFIRIGFQVAAELKVQEAVLKIERLENLSIGGCLLQTSQDFPQGSSCRLTISLDGSTEKILVTGVIARSEPGRIGIKFTGIDPDSLFHLHNILRYNAPDPDQIEQEIDDHPGLI